MCEAALLPSWSCYLCFNLSLTHVTLWKTKSCQSSKNSLKGSHCYFGPDVGATWMFSTLTIIFFYMLQLQKYSPLLPQMLAESKFSKFGHLCFQPCKDALATHFSCLHRTDRLPVPCQQSLGTLLPLRKHFFPHSLGSADLYNFALILTVYIDTDWHFGKFAFSTCICSFCC